MPHRYGLHENPVSQNEARHIKVAARMVRNSLKAVYHHAQKEDHAPRHGSPEDQVSNDPVRRVPYEVATFYDATASDHLQAIYTLLEARKVPATAGLSLLRVAAESSARAWWMLDPEAHVDVRAARGLLERYESLEQRRKIEAGTGNAEARLEELIRDIELAGLAVDVTDKGEMTKVQGEARLNSTDVMKKAGPTKPEEVDQPFGEFLYRFLSASTHASEWLLTLLGREVEGTNDGTGMVQVIFEADPGQLLQLILATIDLYAEAFERRCKLAGWNSFTDQPKWESGIRHELEEAAIALSS